jgi:hypothetical protein
VKQPACGGDELFGVGALLVLEAGPEGIRGLCEHARIGGKIAAAGTTSARAKPLLPCGSCKVSLLLHVSQLSRLSSLEALHASRRRCVHPGCFNVAVSRGILRSRLPVAAKTALATAGTMAEVPASPIPPGGSKLRTMWTSIAGASFMRSIW